MGLAMACELHWHSAMTPKHRRKLSLDRLTVRSLAPAALAGARGGYIRTDMRGACSYSFANDGNTRCDTQSGGTDGCPSGIYSGCEGVC